MKQSSNSYVGLLCATLVTCALFAACGGLDGRKVTRGPDEPVGGTESTAGQGSGATTSAGGSESNAGQTGNPFGGDFSNGGAPVLDGPPEVLKVDPADKADDAEPTGSVSLLFSEALDNATVISDNIKIQDGATEVDGDLSIDGVVATFKPAHRLSLLAQYDVSVSQGVTDSGGQALKAPFASKFNVREGIWGKQTQAFDDQETSGAEQAAATDAQGNTLVVWSRNDANGVRNLYARWYRVSTGWQPEVALEELTGSCFLPRVAVSPDGDAAVTWFASDANNNYRVYARRFVGGDWEASALDVAPMSTDVFNTSADAPSVAIGGGQVVLAWLSVRTVYQPQFEQDYTLYQTAASLDGAWPDYATYVFGSYYTDGHLEDLRHPTVSIDAKGNALGAFAYNAVTTDAGVYYSRKAAAGSWQYATKIVNSTLPNSGPVVVSDGDGAMALWSTYDSMTGKYQVLASRYTKAKQFASPTPIGDPDLTNYVTMTGNNLVSNGKSFWASWAQAIGAAVNVYATRYDIATGKWDASPAVVSDGESRTGGSAAIGVDAHGNALVAFEQEGASNGNLLMFSRFTASDSAWAAPVALSEDGKNYGYPILGMADNGVASVLFSGGGGRQEAGGTPYVNTQFKIFK